LPHSQELNTRLRAKIANLYSQILKYQVQLAHQYSRAGFFRFLRDLFVADNWKDMLMALQKTEEIINKDLQTLDSGSLGTIDLNISKLQDKADDLLIGLNEVRSEVEV
jgi:hypothetical protein